MLAAVPLALLVWGCGGGTGGDTEVDAQFREELKVIQDARILFGHQSVGQNIMEGLASLLKDAGENGLKIETWKETAADTGARLVSAFIGENTHPDSKCRAVESILATAAPSGFDVVLMKFCFIDFNRGTDADKVFRTYREMVMALKAKYPKTVFVHATVPLTAISLRDRLLSPLKLLLGRPNPEIANIRRNEYNQLLRAGFPGEPVFDIAGMEAVRPDGTRATFTEGSKVRDCLAGEYARDGAHLNARGSRRLAREMVRVLALAVRQARASSNTGATGAAQ